MTVYSRQLSAPTSGSARRRARERLRAQQTREEGELLARRRREQRQQDKIQQQTKAREELANYQPWGRAGGGAPNAHGVRFTNLRALAIFPDDEVKGTNQYKGNHPFTSPSSRRRRRHQTPLRLREDPQTLYTETLRKSLDNDIRYRRTPDQQQSYKEILDDLVEEKRRQMKEQRKRDLEYERKMQTMDGPWGKPGPGGTIWRNPRNIGLNFSNSMGWTDNNVFNKLKVDHRRRKRSSLTLPKVMREDNTDILPDKENIKPSNDKLPDIKCAKNSQNVREASSEETVHEAECKPVKSKQKRSPKKNKFVKRLPNGKRITKVLTEDFHNTSFVESNGNGEKKSTPEVTILRMTGGIELVPLLARRRRVGARTLPSSDVTRPPEQACQWREMMDAEYLRELKNQMRVKIEQKEDKQRNSAESVRQHHKTWAALWGRPGHGAPQQRGRYARSNLANLLYLTSET